MTTMHKVTSRGSMKDESRTQGETNGRKLNESSDSSGNGVTAMGPSMDLDEWRKAISTPTRYRVGSASIHMRPRDILQAAVVILIILAVIVLIYNGGGASNAVSSLIGSGKRLSNNQYPLTKPQSIPNGMKYRIGVITDLDHGSKVENEKNLWMSHYLKGYLTVTNDMKFEVSFESESEDLYSSLSLGELY